MKTKTKRKILGYLITGIYVVVIILFFLSVGPKKIGPINLEEINLLEINNKTISKINPFDANEKINTTNINEPLGVSKSEANEKIQNLINILPYEGDNFKIEYNDKKAEFVLVLNKETVTEGTRNFDDFLKENGIQTRKWLKKIYIKYENSSPSATIIYQPTPAPSPTL